MKKHILLFISLTLIANIIQSQSTNLTSFFTDPKEFGELREKRDHLLNEKASLSEKFSSLTKPTDGNYVYTMYDTIFTSDEVKRVTAQLDDLKRSKSPAVGMLDSLQRRLSKLHSDELFFRDYFHDKRVKDSVLSATKAAMENNLAELASVESQINMLMIPEISRQNFMKIISLIFCVLIGLLIALFFSLMRQDGRIRQAIFGGDSGIQFITLFSIVIAIILFGITGTLEGKELSALLGSVSGYILGRVTTKPGNKEADTEKGKTGSQESGNNENKQIPEVKQ